jgi:thiol-disulfide isomerase/thioredoxin
MRALVPPAAGPSRENGSPPRAIAALLLAATIGGFAWFAGRGIQNAEAGTRVLAGKLLKIEDRDTPPIAFDLMTIDGKRVSLSDYKDKVVFVNFWATWCPPCIEEMPSLRKLQEKLAGHDDFVMLLISADESWDPVKRFFPEDKPPFTVLLDQSGALAKQYGTTIFPETYLLASGRIRAFIEGPRDWDAWYAETFLRSFLRNSG